jgi:putative endonuclease
MYLVYIPENPEGRFYTGHTDDLERRLSDHTQPVRGSEKYTHKNGPWKLVWQESHPDRSSAMKRARVIKRSTKVSWLRQATGPNTVWGV